MRCYSTPLDCHAEKNHLVLADLSGDFLNAFVAGDYLKSTKLNQKKPIVATIFKPHPSGKSKEKIEGLLLVSAHVQNSSTNRLIPLLKEINEWKERHNTKFPDEAVGPVIFAGDWNAVQERDISTASKTTTPP